jgi:hypothetical protein
MTHRKLLERTHAPEGLPDADVPSSKPQDLASPDWPGSGESPLSARCHVSMPSLPKVMREAEPPLPGVSAVRMSFTSTAHFPKAAAGQW